MCCGQVVAVKRWRTNFPIDAGIKDVLREIEIGGYVFKERLHLSPYEIVEIASIVTIRI